MQLNELLYYLLCAVIVAAIMFLTLFVAYPFIDKTFEKFKTRR